MRERERERERERDCYFHLPKYNIINISREGGPEREDVRERERDCSVHRLTYKGGIYIYLEREYAGEKGGCEREGERNC